jgi:hypothetical protein
MKVKALREVRVASLNGAVMAFAKGEERVVSDEFASECFATGAFAAVEEVAEEAPAPKPAPAPTPKVEEVADPLAAAAAAAGVETEEEATEEIVATEDMKKVVEAMLAVVADNNPDQLTLDGKPKAFAVKRKLGYDVDGDTRDEAWIIAQEHLPQG